MKEISFKKAAIYNGISKYATMIVQLGISMILARLLMPEAFGIVAIVTIILNFLSLFADMGLGISIIQHPEMEKLEQRKLFSFSIVLGFIVALIMCLMAIPVAYIYHNAQYYILCPLLSVAGFFNTLNIIPNAALARDKRFDLIAIRSVLSALIPGIVAVVLSYFGTGIYALIAQYVFNSIFLFFWNYIKYPLHPTRFEFKIVLGLMGKYSLFQFLFNMLNYFTRNLDNLLIGARLGDEQLGYYNKAYTLNLYPNSIFANIFTGVLHPYIRDYINDFDTLIKRIVDIMKYISFFGVFVSMICFYCAPEIITVFFGSNWEPAILCFQMLTICMWGQMLSSVAGSVFLGIERTDQTFKCGIINIIVIVVAITIGLFNKSIVWVSFCVGIAYNLIFFITYYILIKKTLNRSFLRFMKNFLSDFVFTVLCFIGIWLFAPQLEMGLWLRMIVKSCLCLIVFLLYVLLSGKYKLLCQMVRRL